MPSPSYKKIKVFYHQKPVPSTTITSYLKTYLSKYHTHLFPNPFDYESKGEEILLSPSDLNLVNCLLNQEGYSVEWVNP